MQAQLTIQSPFWKRPLFCTFALEREHYERVNTMNARNSSHIVLFGLMRKHPRLLRLCSLCLVLLMLLPYPQQIRAMMAMADDGSIVMIGVTSDAGAMEHTESVGLTHSMTSGQEHKQTSMPMASSDMDCCDDENESDGSDNVLDLDNASDSGNLSGLDNLSDPGNLFDPGNMSDSSDRSDVPKGTDSIAQASPVSHACCAPSVSHQPEENRVHNATNHCSGASFCQCSHEEPQPHVSVLPPPVVQSTLIFVTYTNRPFFSSATKNTRRDDTSHLHPATDLFLMHDSWLI